MYADLETLGHNRLLGFVNERASNKQEFKLSTCGELIVASSIP